MVGTDFVIHFTINDQEHESPEAQVSVAWLLAQAGLGTVDAEVVRRATGETWHDPNAAIELHDGDAFVA